MKLSVNNGEKVYTADTADISFGIMEDVADAIDLDKLSEGTDTEIMSAALKFVVNSMDVVKRMLKEVFSGITDEEIRTAKMSEICAVFFDIGKYTIAELTRHIKEKN
jgi:hypothetical protein